MLPSQRNGGQELLTGNRLSLCERQVTAGLATLSLATLSLATLSLATLSLATLSLGLGLFSQEARAGRWTTSAP